MIPCYPVTHAFGGLEIVQDTANDKCQKILCEDNKYELYHNKRDFMSIKSGHTYDGLGKLVKCDPGDMILWDSRTVHGGTQGYSDFSSLSKEDLVRLSMTVCYTPKAWADEKILIKRRESFLSG